MKVLALCALMLSSCNAGSVGAWEKCAVNSDCKAGLYCCNVTKDGQSPTKLCGNGPEVPLGSPSDAYDTGKAVCKADAAATNAKSIQFSAITVVLATTAYYM